MGAGIKLALFFIPGEAIVDGSAQAWLIVEATDDWDRADFFDVEGFYFLTPVGGKRNRLKT